MSRDVLKGRWSLSHERCRGCGGTERPHRSKGYCQPCLHKAEYEEPWPVGLRVWVPSEGQWVSGIIVERPFPSAALVRLDSGETLYRGFSRGNIRLHEPKGVPVPKRHLVTSQTGVILRLFVTGDDGKIVRRDRSVWSAKHDRCQGCGTTEKPHEARGFCHRCYRNWCYRTNKAGCADRSRARLKLRRMYDPAVEEREKAKYERIRHTPEFKERRRRTCRAWAQRNTAKWPVGSVVETPLGNVNIDVKGNRVVLNLARKPAEWGALRMTGRIIEVDNGSALVDFDGDRLRVPFARLRIVAKEARLAA